MCDIAIHLSEVGVMAALFVAGICTGWIFAVLKGVC